MAVIQIFPREGLGEKGGKGKEEARQSTDVEMYRRKRRYVRSLLYNAKERERGQPSARRNSPGPKRKKKKPTTV